jgi:leader peptidase (prepilin peptidase)/N-methyltransferase
VTIAAPAAIAVAGTFVAAATDVRTGLIPDPLTLATVTLALAAAAGTGTIPAAIGGGLAAGGALLALHLCTRRRGLGLGDVKLGVAIGVGLGASAALEALGVAFVAGALGGVGLLVARRAHRRSALPFAPFLALGTAIAAVAGSAAR